MDHYLKGIDNGVDRESPVRYFVMAAMSGARAKHGRPPRKGLRTICSAIRKAMPLTGRGKLSTAIPETSKSSSTFLSDPQNPVKNIYSSSGAHDYGGFS